MQFSHLDSSRETARTPSVDIGGTFSLSGKGLDRNTTRLLPDPAGVARESVTGHANLAGLLRDLTEVVFASCFGVQRGML